MTKNLRQPCGDLVINPNGTIAEMPLFLSEHFGWSDSVYELFNTEAIPHLTVTRLMKSKGGVTEFHVGLVDEDGPRPAYRYWHSGNTDEEIRFFFIDDSAIHRTHEFQFKRIRDSILGDVQSFVATHLKNRLSTLRVLSDMTVDGAMSAETARRFFETLSQFELIIEAFDDELHTSTTHVGPRKPIALSEISAVISTWYEGREIPIRFDDDVDLETNVDAVVLRHVIFPVVSNALESSDPAHIEIEVQAVKRTPSIAFIVTDNGSGMTREQAARAEDPFFSTKRGHLGLGLSKAKIALKNLGGYWNIKSDVGTGTAVRVVTPIVTPDD